MDFEVHVGKQVELDFVLKDGNGVVHPDPEGAQPLWVVSDPEVATLDFASGDQVHLRGLKEGTVTVTGTEGFYTASATGTVVAAEVPLTAEIDVGPETDIPPAAA